MFSRLFEEARHHKRVHLSGVNDSARAFVAAGLCRQLNSPLLWLLPDERRAEQAARSLSLFWDRQDQDPGDPFAGVWAPFPLHQASPYEDLSPDREATAERLALLFRLAQGSPPKLMICSVQALMRLGLSRQSLEKTSQLILVGQELDRRAFTENLVRAGYLSVPLVEDPGHFAIRGGILDVFTPQLALPLRIELLGDEVESIRVFDPASQRTVAKSDCAYLGPVQEILQDPESRTRALAAVDALGAALDLPSHKILRHRRQIDEGLRYFGIESLLPAFEANPDCLLDFFPEDTRILIDDPGAVQAEVRTFYANAQAGYEQALKGNELVFSPERLLLSPAEVEDRLGAMQNLSFGLNESAKEESTPALEINLPSEPVSGLRQAIMAAGPEDDAIEPLTERLKTWRREGLRPFLCAARPGRARQLAQMIQSRGLAVRIEQEPFDWDWLKQNTPNLFARIIPGELDQGFVAPWAKLAIVPDNEVFGRPARRSRPPKPARQVASLKPGELVVHSDFGIARFDGLVKLEVAGSESDFLALFFRDEDKLYLPVTRMSLLERYTGGDAESVGLNKLGGKSWLRTKKRIAESLLEMADELVRTEAQRRSLRGPQAVQVDDQFRALSASFPYEETEDQRQTIDEVIRDMQSPHAMDRLVCGDVGFGKTEVAIRAAYLNALSGRQTAVLVPTTILAMQHLATFRERLDAVGVNVAMLSRLTPASDVSSIHQQLEEGLIDVLVGTHRLLTDAVRYKNLGLLVIDEEHRFGVKQKERLKQLRENVDVLTMTASPLPRTLQLGMSGLRPISVIRTPPPGRRAVRTIITRFSERVVAEAIQRERQRGGQVFFVHNFVRSLPAMSRFLKRVVPDARVAIGHGQLPVRELEQVMQDFIERRVDVLLSTSIIESGLDIPTANTVIVNRADRFGLAQLYQIRGRVGRAAERAYAYFLIPGLDSVSSDARKRLEALADASDLGAGFKLASRDLEIRGAGNLLGKAQSGHIKAIGFDLYSRLLERAIMEVKGKGQGSGLDPEIKLPVAGLLAEDYVPELDHRLDLYARLSRAESVEAVFELEQEIVDRFGPGPPELSNLIELMALKAQLRELGVPSLTWRAGQLRFELDTSGNFDPAPFVQISSEQASRARLDPAGAMIIELSGEDRSQPLPAARQLATRLQALAKK